MSKIIQTISSRSFGWCGRFFAERRDPPDCWHARIQLIPFVHRMYSETYETRLDWYLRDYPDIRTSLSVFVPFFLETDRDAKIRKYLECQLQFPPTEAGEDTIFQLFWSTRLVRESEETSIFWIDWGPVTDPLLVGEFDSRIFRESSLLLRELGEFWRGYTDYGNIFFWKQVRDAFRICLDSENPEANWKTAIEQGGFSFEQIRDRTFLDGYYAWSEISTE